MTEEIMPWDKSENIVIPVIPKQKKSKKAAPEEDPWDRPGNITIRPDQVARHQPKGYATLDQLQYGILDGVASLVGFPIDVVKFAVLTPLLADNQNFTEALRTEWLLDSGFNKRWLKELGITGDESEDMAGKVARFVGELVGGGAIAPPISGTGKFLTTFGKAARTRRSIGSAQKSARAIEQEAVADPMEAFQRLERRSEEFGLPTDYTKVEASPGIIPTTAQLMGDPALLGLEYELARLSPVIHQRLVDRQSKNVIAVNELFNAMAPANTTDDALRNLLKAKVSGSIDTLEARMQVYKDGISDLVNKGMSPQSASKEFSSYLDELWKARKGVEQELWQGVDPTGVWRGDVGNLIAFAKDMVEKRLKTENPLDTPKEVIARIDSLSKRRKGVAANKVTFKELQALRSDILHEIRRESAKPVSETSPNKVRKLNLIRDEVEGIFEQLTNDFDKGLAARYQAARQYTRESALLFRTGPASKVMRDGPQSVPESATLDVLFKGGRGSEEAANQLKELVGNSEDARMLVRDYAIRLIADQTTDKNGQIKLAAFRKLVEKKFAPALKSFPDLRKELFDISRMQKEIDTLANRVAKRQDLIEQSSLRLFLDDPEGVAMKGLLKRKDKVSEARRLWGLTARDQDAQQGLKRALWDEFVNQATTVELDGLGNPLLNPSAIRKFIKNNDGVLKEFRYSEQDLENVLRMAEHMEVLQKTTLPGKISPSISNIVQPIIPFSMFATRLQDLVKHRVSPFVLGADISSRIFRRQIEAIRIQELHRLLGEAVVNPRLAAILLDPINRKLPERSYNTLRSALVGMGIITLQELEQISQEVLRSELKRIKLQNPQLLREQSKTPTL